jgi:hypothetical protein
MDIVNNIDIQYLFYKIYTAIRMGNFLPTFFSSGTILTFKIISIIFSWCLLVFIGLTANKLWKLRSGQYHGLLKSMADRRDSSGLINEQWSKVLNLINSTNEADWIKAIIEADKMLEDVVGTMKVDGNTLGERMKNIEAADFPVLQDAWDAHKVRNRIAHEPGYQLTDREAQRVIGLYGKVFRSVKYI